MKLVAAANKRRKILDFDIENRPLAYWWGDATTGEITAIAWSFNNPGDVAVRALGEVSTREILEDFLEAWNEADVVTGHYIRKHDIPTINAMLFEQGMLPLERKQIHDTKLDFKAGFKHLSASQESLAAMLGIEAPKIQMDQKKWREANRLTPEGIALTKERVIGDVIQHMELRNALIELGWLDPPSD